MSIIVLGLYNISLGKENVKEDDYIVEMVLDEEILKELLEEEEKLEELANADPLKSHSAFNETAKPSYGDPEPLKTLEELVAEIKAAESEAGETTDAISDAAYAAKIKELAKKREEKKQKLGEKEAKKEKFTNALAARRTSVSYSLVDRHHYDLPPPIYTCIEGGKVVINIVVDARGNVTEADFNAKSSNTSNGCLVDNAVKYALKAQFNTDAKATQKGSITYLFQKKTY